MGDKVKANVQWCLQFIPTQRAVNYAEQARRHPQAGVNGEGKLCTAGILPLLFPAHQQHVPQDTWGCLQRRQLFPNIPSSWLSLLTRLHGL